MGEYANQYWSTNLSGNWVLSTISTNDSYTVGTKLDSRLYKLENENKELKKRLSNLATLVCTHIGKEQMEKFYKENE